MFMDPELDLTLHRDLPVPPEAVWRAWTQPELLKAWFTPRPWRTVEAEIDPVPGGIFRTVMAGPDGESGGGTGCVLEAVPARRLVWTGSMTPGFRPVVVTDWSVPIFTAVIELAPAPDGGTAYDVTVRHATAEGCRTHAEMGFETGWNAAIDQLVEVVRAQSQ